MTKDTPFISTSRAAAIAGLCVLATMLVLESGRVGAAGMDRERLRALTSSVESLCENGKADSARVLVRKQLAKDSTTVDLWLLLARVDKKRGRLAERQRALERVFRLQPRTLEGRLEIIPDLLSRGQIDSAMARAYQVVVLGTPPDPRGWYWIGRAHSQAARFDSATTAYKRAYSGTDADPF